MEDHDAGDEVGDFATTEDENVVGDGCRAPAGCEAHVLAAVLDAGFAHVCRVSGISKKNSCFQTWRRFD